MRPFRFGRWGSSGLPLGTRPRGMVHCGRNMGHDIQRRTISTTRLSLESSDGSLKRGRGRPRKLQALQSSVAPTANASTASSNPIPPEEEIEEEEFDEEFDEEDGDTPVRLEDLPSPPPHLATSSAKLAALHARLALPKSLPLSTLARCLVHPTADHHPHFNNSSLSTLGHDLLGYYMSEHLLAHYPRLPLPILFAAQSAYIGRESLTQVAQSWGVEAAGEPGGEVDPGLLQFKRAPPGAQTELPPSDTTRPQDRNRRGEVVNWRRGQSSRTVYDDQFGDVQKMPGSVEAPTTTLDRASASFVSALAGALYLHAGAQATAFFFKSHVSSRQLDLSKLFTFKQPTRDLSRLCAREGFPSPVARIDATTGETSTSPVFVVGVYSGASRLGQGAGSTKYEARWRAAVAALKGWYLYSPSAVQGGKAVMPSETEGIAGKARSKDFKPLHVDFGEVIA